MNELAVKIRDTVIDTILASPLNIAGLDDTLERELYESIFNILQHHTTPSTWCSIL